MPIYEFTCKQCGTISDELVKIGTQKHKCKCGGEMVKSQGSYLTVSTGLPNGHCGSRVKK